MFEIGNSLREARERQGLDFPQLEADTRIRAKYLRALEEELFEMLPAESYARGFLEVYAKRLGLDSQLFVDEFDSRFARGDYSNQAVRRVRSARRPRLEASAVLLGLIGILVVTVLVIAAWQFSGSKSETPVAETAGVEPSTLSVQPPPAPEASLPDASAANGPTEQEPLAVEVRIVEIEVAAIRGASRVTIRRNGPQGRVIFAGVLSRGESRTFTGERLHAAFRAPGRLQVEVDGERVLPLPKRLLVTTEGWRRS